ncbi:unnamed protein product [Oncorhynchus mykiss]|uniref:Uncharacterized protein n=1 Tax=Oncorhynchus mykiss TaxID=8022 RepID=A0A060YU39_ONCMY|nr:unnamed protein product [Oncorhynchus mykiss]
MFVYLHFSLACSFNCFTAYGVFVPFLTRHLPRPPTLPPKPQKMRKPRPRSIYNHKLFNGNMETFIKDSGQPIPLVVESCIRHINLYGKSTKMTPLLY